MKRILSILMLAVCAVAGAQTPAYISAGQTNPQTVKGPLNSKAINNVYNVALFTGATADVQLNACLAAIPSGGVCDARSYGNTTQSLAATVTLAAKQTLLFSPSTKFQPASTALTLFTYVATSHIKGIWVDMANLTANTWTGTVFNFSGTNVNGQYTSLEDFQVTGAAQKSGGSGIKINYGGTFGITFATFKNGRIYGMHDGINLVLTGSSGPWINGNTFDDIVVSGATSAITLNNTSNGVINANQFINISTQEDGATGQVGLSCLGTGVIYQNMFVNLNIWDTTEAGAFLFSNPNTYQNYFMGHFDGTITDTVIGNNIFNLQDSTSKVFASTYFVSTLFVSSHGIGTFNGVDLSIGSGTSAAHSLLVHNPANTLNVVQVDDVGNMRLVGNYENAGGNIILPSTLTGDHGSGTKVQLNDGTGASQPATYKADGTLTAAATGVATLVAGTATVSNAGACTPSSTCVYKLTRCAANASTGIGSLSIGTVSVGTSFVINSLGPTASVLTTDLSTVCWQIN